MKEYISYVNKLHCLETVAVSVSFEIDIKKGGNKEMQNKLKARAEGLVPLFYPASIAIIGASDEARKPGGSVLNNLNEGFRGKVFPVNPNQQEIHGLTCYPSVLALPESVDMVVVAIPAPYVYQTLETCIAKGIKGAVVFSSGFAETGRAGADLQEKISELAARHNFRICGPNCMGIANFTINMNAVFSYGGIFVACPPGISQTVGFVTQSGGFGCSVIAMAGNQDFGFSHYISTGNEAESDFSDYLAFLINDPQTNIIAGYMEGIRNGQKLALAADMAMEANKPLVIYKTGRYQASAKAALSHTGSLAGSELVFSSFFRQKGILRPDSIEELCAILTLLNTKRLPKGYKTVIFASSGGHGVVMADKCSEVGLDVITLSETTRQKIAKILPAFASSANPIDSTGLDMNSPEVLKAYAGYVADDPGVDILIFSHWATESLCDPFLEQLVQIASSTTKPVIVVIMGGVAATAAEHLKHFKKRGIPALMGLDFAMKAIKKVTDYQLKVNSWQQTFAQPTSHPVKERVGKILARYTPGAQLSEGQTKEILTAYGIPVTREKGAATVREAIAAADQIGYPVVLKVDSPDILHKTEAGGIKLNLTSAEQVEKAFAEILTSARLYRPEGNITGALVQEMLGEGTEVIVGIGSDPAFGSTVVFGLGGVLVELLGDISLRVVPLCDTDAREMMNEIKGRRILEGVRGKPAADKNAIADIILKVSQLAADFPQIAELDINPLVVFADGKGACAADALIVLK